MYVEQEELLPKEPGEPPAMHWEARLLNCCVCMQHRTILYFRLGGRIIMKTCTIMILMTLRHFSHILMITLKSRRNKKRLGHRLKKFLFINF